MCAISALRIHEAKVTTGDVQPAIDAEAEAVRGMVRRTVLVPKRNALHQRLALFRHTVAILVDEEAHIRRMHHVEAIVVPHETTRSIEVLHELRHLIRASIAILVAQAQDATTLRTAA